MELKVYSSAMEEKGSTKMPSQFSETVRPDLIKRAVLVVQANARQAYGAKWQAGMRHSGKLSRRRRDYKASYGHGISRVPRKILSRRGDRMHWVGAVAPGTVGGREAHPPKPGKDWSQKINTKENRLAIRSALSATMHPEIVKEHGYQIPKHYPFIISDDVEKLGKAKDVADMLEKLGFADEAMRAGVKKIRAGRGKMRNRPYKKKTSVLFVVAGDCNLVRGAANLPGVDVCAAASLSALMLAPGGVPGRATLYTQGAIKKIGEGLFTDAVKNKEKMKKTKEINQ